MLAVMARGKVLVCAMVTCFFMFRSSLYALFILCFKTLQIKFEFSKKNFENSSQVSSSIILKIQNPMIA
jgi:hypothetical protein